MVLSILKWTLSLLACWALAHHVYSDRHRFSLIPQVFGRFRPVMFFECVLEIAVVIVVGSALSEVPYLGHGWSYLIFGHDVNVVMSPAVQATGSSSFFLKGFGVVFLCSFLVAMPLLTFTEEMIFRKGFVKWPAIFRQSLVFGLVHCVVGIPLAWGLALFFAGLFFGYKYKRSYEANFDPVTGAGYYRGHKEAVLVSTTYHTMHNVILCVLALGGILLLSE